MLRFLIYNKKEKKNEHNNKKYYSIPFAIYFNNKPSLSGLLFQS